MNIQALLASSIDGVMLGFVYGLAAMGLALIFGVMRVINLAHGSIIMLGMFAVYFLTNQFGLNPYLGLILVLLLGLAFGFLMYFIAVHRVINAPERTTLLATFSVNLMILGLATSAFTTTPRALSVDLGAFRSGAITVLGTRLFAVVIAIVIAAGLYAFLYRTRVGKSIRAVSNNRSAAELMGINSTRTLALTFGLGTMLAMVSGVLIATLFSFTPLSGTAFQVKSFVIITLGGIGNPAGALIGGIILGVLEGVTTLYIPAGWVPVIEYVIFVLILIVRPTGLFKGR
jgi:branched-subunit amino acid ABC-type transport system permease component